MTQANLDATAPGAAAADRPASHGRWLLAAALAFPLLIAPPLAGGYTELDAAANVEAASSNVASQVFWTLVFVGAISSGRRISIPGLAGRLWPLTLYLLWGALSLSWAMAPDIALRRLLLQVFVVGAVVLPIALIADGEKIRSTVLRVMFLTLLANVAALAIKPPTPLGYAGIYAQKNELGVSAALGLMSCLIGLFAGQRIDRLLAWTGLPMAILLLVASRSKTSLILALAVPGLAWGLAAAARSLRLAPTILVASVLAIGIPLGLLIVELCGITLAGTLRFLFGDATFTGRTDIWEFAWSRILDRPVGGHGFNGFWGAGDASGALSTGSEFLASILQAHNGYLDILLDTGFVGFALFLALLGAIAAGAGPCLARSRADGVFVLAFGLFATLHNLFESSALRRFHAVWLLLLVAAAIAATSGSTARPAHEKGDSPC